jgi:hypothetical protein
MNQTLNPNLLFNKQLLFKDLNREAKKELRDKEIRANSIANTYQNEPQYQKAFNKADLDYRSGTGIYAPIAYEQNNSRKQQFENDGRNLWMLNTLKANKKIHYPDVITAYPRKVIGIL